MSEPNRVDVAESIANVATHVQTALDDPWQHRSQGMRCESCMWFVEKAQSGGLGRCRRHAPTMSGWPVVYPRDWCGDHKLESAET